jgi:hypothetical protein
MQRMCSKSFARSIATHQNSETSFQAFSFNSKEVKDFQYFEVSFQDSAPLTTIKWLG